MKPLKTEAPEKKFSLLDESRKLFESRFYDSFFVNEYGRLEGVRSERYANPFSVVILQIESFYEGKTVPAKKDLLVFLKNVVTSILKIIRNCDVAGMLEDKRIIIILPNTDYFGSLVTIKKLSKTLEFVTTGGEPYASLILSQGTYPRDGKGYGELVSVATKRIAEIRESTWEKMRFKNKFFWEIIAGLTEGGYADSGSATFDAGQGSDLDGSFINKITDVILEEITRTPEKKGVLYIGAKNISDDLPFKKTLDSMGKTGTRIFIVGAEKQAEIKNATTITLNDTRIGTTYFLFFLNEAASYALVCKEGWGGTYMCFHTSDPYLVEGLISKFQRDYALQEQF